MGDFKWVRRQIVRCFLLKWWKQVSFHIAFEEAVVLFYKSETYKTLQETENGLWAESAEYIADRYYEEQGK